jgi:hypothetical protein
MKRTNAVAVFATVMLALASVCFAQGPRYSGMHRYDPKTEMTIQGVVEKVGRINSPNMTGTRIQLTVKSDNETFNVYLGPAEYVDKSMTFKEGDSVQVTGSKVTIADKTAFLAREVKKGDQTLKLRDERGIPLWRGMRVPTS